MNDKTKYYVEKGNRRGVKLKAGPNGRVLRFSGGEWLITVLDNSRLESDAFEVFEVTQYKTLVPRNHRHREKGNAMKANRENSKFVTNAGSSTSANLRFIADLLSNLSSKLSPTTDIGCGLHFSILLDNLSTTSLATGFAGVYLHYSDKATGVKAISFRAMVAKTSKHDKVRSRLFSVNKYGVNLAFSNAVRLRAEFLEIEGYIPCDELVPPSVETIYKHALTTKGIDWVNKKGIANALGLSPTTEAQLIVSVEEGQHNEY